MAAVGRRIVSECAASCVGANDVVEKLSARQREDAGNCDRDQLKRVSLAAILFTSKDNVAVSGLIKVIMPLTMTAPLGKGLTMPACVLTQRCGKRDVSWATGEKSLLGDPNKGQAENR